MKLDLGGLDLTKDILLIMTIQCASNTDLKDEMICIFCSTQYFDVKIGTDTYFDTKLSKNNNKF